MTTQTITDVSSAPPRTRRVLVGFDASSGAHAALEWAADEAVARNMSLHILMCSIPPVAVDFSGVGARGNELLGDAVAAIRQRHPGLGVDAVATHLDPRDALIDEADRAELLVVGPSASGTAKSLLLGSVPRSAARRSPCPVVVVRGACHHPLRRIVVGVDGSTPADTALDWATRLAARDDAEIEIVHAWQAAGHGHDDPLGPHGARLEAHAVLDRAIARCRRHGHAHVRGRLVEGAPAVVLAEASRDADLVAVGSRGRSGFKTRLFGSVAIAITDHAACPVAVLPPRATHQFESPR